MFGLETLVAQAPQPQQNLVDTLARTPLSQIITLAAVCTVIRLAIMGYLANTPVHKRTGAYSVASFVNGLTDAIVYAAILIFFGVRPFIFQTYQIPSESMENTLLVGDMIGINKAVYRYSDPKVNDIVVFRPPAYACYPWQLDEKGEPKIDFIKRCIGTPGDLIEIKDNQLYRNGEAVKETYLKSINNLNFKLVNDNGTYKPITYVGFEVNTGPVAMQWRLDPMDRDEMDRLMALPAVKIPEGHYLMMGDNREGSFDGRGWGLIKRDQVVGRCDFIWMPISRIRGTRGIPAASQ